MKTAITAAIVVLLLAMGSAALAQRGAPVVDQRQTATQPTTALVIGGDSQQKLAQIVRTGVAGFLVELRLPVECASEAELIVEIVESEGLGVPTATVRSSQRFPGTALPTLRSFQPLALARPVFFAAGRLFGFVLNSTGACGMAVSPPGDTYTGGRGYFDARPNPPGAWVCMCEFPGQGFDLAFETVVQPACLVPKVRGMRVVAAVGALRRNGCRPSRTRRLPSRRVKKGFVSGQLPAPGTELAPNAGVRLVVSSGRKRTRRG